MSCGRYILKGHKPVPEPDLIKWARWMETADRHVRDTLQGDLRVSTVFLGLDHGWDGRKELFETMVFRGWTTVEIGEEIREVREGHESERYATWDEAEAGHAGWVAKIFRAVPAQ